MSAAGRCISIPAASLSGISETVAGGASAAASGATVDGASCAAERPVESDAMALAVVGEDEFQKVCRDRKA